MNEVTVVLSSVVLPDISVHEQRQEQVDSAVENCTDHAVALFLREMMFRNP